MRVQHRVEDGYDIYYIKERIGNQTFFIEFEDCGTSNDNTTIYWNIGLGVYSKRKHIDRNEDLVLSTGKNPWATYKVGLKAFKILEQEILTTYPDYSNYICCFWTDNRRREVYYKILSKFGYDYGYNWANRKVIFKKYPPYSRA